jgi:hypothetical protein
MVTALTKGRRLLRQGGVRTQIKPWKNGGTAGAPVAKLAIKSVSSRLYLLFVASGSLLPRKKNRFIHIACAVVRNGADHIRSSAFDLILWTSRFRFRPSSEQKRQNVSYDLFRKFYELINFFLKRNCSFLHYSNEWKKPQLLRHISLTRNPDLEEP